MMIMLRTMCCMAAATSLLVASAPGHQGVIKEHRQKVPVIVSASAVSGDEAQTGDFIKIIDTSFLSSDAMASLDRAAARLTTMFGDMFEEVGGFFASAVGEVPHVVRRISERVDHAVHNDNASFVDAVKDLHANVNNATKIMSHNIHTVTKEVGQKLESATKQVGHTIHTVNNQVKNAVKNSETYPIVFNLGQRVGATLDRIFDAFTSNLGQLDKAMAGGIRRVSDTVHKANMEASTITKIPSKNVPTFSRLSTASPVKDDSKLIIISTTPTKDNSFEIHPTQVKNDSLKIATTNTTPFEEPLENEIRRLR